MSEEEAAVHTPFGDLPASEKEELIVSLASMVIHDSGKDFSVRLLLNPHACGYY
jgi:hypothetical protein